MTYQMPKADLHKLYHGVTFYSKSQNRFVSLSGTKDCEDEHKKIVELVLKADGTVRSTKPEKKTDLLGKVAYVWRMVVFTVSQNPKHQCMPITADFDLPAYGEDGKWSCAEARKMAESLNPVIDLIVNSIPKEQWHGINRWGRALLGDNY